MDAQESIDEDVTEPGNEPGTNTCAACGHPMTGSANGECLHCALGVALADEEESGDEGFETKRGPVFSRYGHFEVVVGDDGLPAELGSGAMATTYRAIDTVLHSAVALKVINKNVSANPMARSRFLREARAAAKLHHPNVAPVTFYGEQEGECYYVMELVEGETLAERVTRAGVFSAKCAIEIGVQVARALAAAEAVGVVHRDLKPSNLMLTSHQGEKTNDSDDADEKSQPIHVKVIDWGLAKALSNEAVLEADRTREVFVGTPAFASPEQFGLADGQRIDTRSDIYSLGVTLWYLLTGRAPFVGDSLEVIHERQKELPFAQLATANVPACLTEALRSMLAFDPAARPQSARELLDVLRRCQEQSLSDNHPAPSRSRRFRFAGAIALLVLLSLGTFGVVKRWQQPATPRISRDCSIAVLPFENLSPEPADAFFTTAVQDQVTTGLSRIATIRVIDPDSTRSYLPQHRDFARIGRELNVRHLLEGHVRKEGEEVHVEIKLVDVKAPDKPWAEQYVRRLNDVFAVQGEITRAVAARMRTVLSDAEKAAIDRPPTSDLTAYQLYLSVHEGGPLFSGSEERHRYTLETRIPVLEKAIARDPKFAFAYCDLADAYDLLYSDKIASGRSEEAENQRRKAEAALANARRLRPDAGEVHLAEARHLSDVTQDPDQARVELELARRSLPNSAPVESLAGYIAMAQSRWQECVRSFEETVALEPRNNGRRRDLANAYRFLRRFADADREVAVMLANSPPGEVGTLHLFRALNRFEEDGNLAPLREASNAAATKGELPIERQHMNSLLLALFSHDADAVSRLLAELSGNRCELGNIMYPKAWFEALAARMRGDETAAQEAFQRARIDAEQIVNEGRTDGPRLSLLAMIDAALGNKEVAVREALHASELAPVERLSLDAPIVACHLAVVYAWTGQPNLACSLLDKWVGRPAGYDTPRKPSYGDFRLDPIWDALRGNPRFEAVVARLAPVPTR